MLRCVATILVLSVASAAFADLPIHLKKSRNVGQAITVDVDVKVSNTGRITGIANLKNFQALLGGQAQWNFVLLDEDGNCLWMSDDEWHTVAPCSIFNTKGERSSKKINQEFPKEIVERVADVDVILTRRDKHLGDIVRETLEECKKHLRTAEEVQDGLDRLMGQ